MKAILSTLGYAALAVITASLLFTSCSDDDDSDNNEACFNLMIDDGTAEFDASCSQNAVGYQWNFGNGDEVSQIVPTVEYFYAAPGNYTVTLLVTFNGGGQQTTQREITVDEVCLRCTCIGPWVGGTQTIECGTSAAILSSLCNPLCTSMGSGDPETNCTCSYE